MTKLAPDNDGTYRKDNGDVANKQAGNGTALMTNFQKSFYMIPYLVGMESLDKRGYFRLISIKTMPNILYINTV